MVRSLLILFTSSLIFAWTGCTVISDEASATLTATVIGVSTRPLSVDEQERVAEPFEGILTVYSGDPVFQRGRPDTWDATSVEPGAILFHDGLFHMFYNGSSESSPGGIGYAISTDGYAWYRMTAAPVLTADDVDYAFSVVRASSVFVRGDGTWVMYFSTERRSRGEPAGAIARATANQPAGPWTPEDMPVLQPGRLNTWDEPVVSQPDVLKTDDGYVMYYTGLYYREANWTSSIGLATSPDGVTWIKYNDPTTMEGLFRDSDVVLGTGVSEWEAGMVMSPRVWRMPDAWGMIYTGISSSERVVSVGYATSLNGVAWTRFEGNPILTTEDIWNVVSVGTLELLCHEGKYLLYFSGTKDDRTWDIYLAASGQ